MFRTSDPYLRTSGQSQQANQIVKAIKIRSERAALIGIGALLALLGGCRKIQVATNHNDKLRTGWNQFERHLTYANVPSLTALPPITLDDEVDTQPLVVPNVRITASAAVESGRSTLFTVARNIEVLGTYDANGILHAESIQRAKAPATWPSDR